MEKAREKFLRAYPEVPEELRKNIIVVINDKSYTWDTAYFEVKNNPKSELSGKILKTLLIIGII
jgi:hypothetical protein